MIFPKVKVPENVKTTDITHNNIKNVQGKMVVQDRKARPIEGEQSQ